MEFSHALEKIIAINPLDSHFRVNIFSGYNVNNRAIMEW